MYDNPSGARTAIGNINSQIAPWIVAESPIQCASRLKESRRASSQKLLTPSINRSKKIPCFADDSKSMRSQKVTFKKIWLGTALAVWGIVVSLAVMPFFSGHLLVFEGWGKNLALQAKGSWALTHILGEGCVCSETIGKYLLNRGLIELHEKILFLGTNLPLEAELKAKGFQIEKRDPATLSPEAASAVPTLLISDPSGAVVYSGGYADHKIRAGAEIQDVKMLERLKTQTHLAVLPVFGCAMSKRYQNLLDPLGVKSRGLLR